MFSNKTLLSVMAATGLSFGAAACGSDGSSLNFLCEAAYECAYGTFSYEYAGGVDGEDAGASADELDDLTALAVCAALLGGTGSVEDEAVTACVAEAFAELEDPSEFVVESCDVSVELDETTYTASVEATVDIYEDSDFDTEDPCTDLEDELGITAE